MAGAVAHIFKRNRVPSVGIRGHLKCIQADLRDGRRVTRTPPQESGLRACAGPHPLVRCEPPTAAHAKSPEQGILVDGLELRRDLISDRKRFCIVDTHLIDYPRPRAAAIEAGVPILRAQNTACHLQPTRDARLGHRYSRGTRARKTRPATSIPRRRQQSLRAVR